jgi:hypothetical protein
VVPGRTRRKLIDSSNNTGACFSFEFVMRTPWGVVTVHCAA